MQKYTEQDIIEGCKAQEQAFQRLLYEKMYNLFLKICMRYTQCQQDAELVLHDGFLKIYTNIQAYQYKGSFEGWMKRILINTCLDYVKSKSQVYKKQTDYKEEMFEFNISSNDINALEQMSMQEILEEIRTLPPVSQTVFNLFAIDGYSHKEISVALQITVGTSQWHVNNARKILQEKLKHLYK